MLSVVNAYGATETGSLIDDIVREGARQMLAAALEAEVNAYIAELTDQRDGHGCRLAVRNGYHQLRKVTTAIRCATALAPSGTTATPLPRSGTTRPPAADRHHPAAAAPPPQGATSADLAATSPSSICS